MISLGKKVEGTVELANKLVETIVSDLKELYGSYWNFEVDFKEGSDPTRNFTLRVKVYKR